ncbi:MAG: EAL domain-containing protein [Oscillospiraceae bacterium]|nr:EAL domain-containing protein [Oscillospiraceae bacterium]
MPNLNKIANTKIKKSSILPTFVWGLITLGFMVIILISGLALSVIAMLDIESKHYNDSTGIIASGIEENIKSRIEATEDFAQKFSNDEIDASLAEKFGIASSFETYETSFVVTTNGVGYDNNGKAVNLKSKPFFRNSIPAKTIVCYDGEMFKDKIIIITPKIKNFSCEGYFISVSSISFDIPQKFANDVYEMYLLDDENNIIAHNELGRDDFDVNSIKNGNTNDSEMTMWYRDLISEDFETLKDDEEDTVEIDLKKMISSTVPMNIWYKHPLEMNDWQVVSKVNISRGVSKEDSFAILLVWMIVGPAIIIFITLIINFASMAGQISSNRKLISLIYLDTITGKTNWLKFKSDAAKLLKKRRKNEYALVSFDICKFRMYSDMYGSNEADKLIVRVSDICHNFIKKRHELATRHGGDTFALLIEYTDFDMLKKRVEDLSSALSKVQAKTATKYHFGVYEIKDRTMAIDRINNLSGIAKDSGANSSQMNGISYFNNEIHLKLVNEREIENTMEAALEKKEFIVYLQPKYNSQTEELSGAEALVRWLSEEKGLMSPAKFIPIFEKNGFITKLDDYMLNEICALQKKWYDEGRKLFPISVNISRAHFEKPDLAEHIRDIVKKYEIPFSCVEIELTESAFFDDKNLLIETVKRLRQYGFVVSMDDFGSGFSSLNSLKDIPLDVIKLDAGFFNIANDEDNRSSFIIEDTIAMAKHLRMQTVAEGIETRQQVDFLCSLGCDLIQGYYFARPMPVDEFERHNGYDMANSVSEETKQEESVSEEDISEETSETAIETAEPEAEEIIEVVEAEIVSAEETVETTEASEESVETSDEEE